MARPIEPTPILKGRDAKEFLKDLHKNKKTPAISKHLDECQLIYERFQAKMTASLNNGNCSL